MGLESDLYYYQPASEGTHELSAVLERVGAERTVNVEASPYYVLRGPDYWIDIQTGMPSEGLYPSAFIRVALTNPPMVLNVLKDLFSALLASGGGYIEDRNKNVFDVTHQSGHQYRQIDEGTWQSIRAAFETRRTQFQQHFGNFVAPISGDDVFEYIRQHHT